MTSTRGGWRSFTKRLDTMLHPDNSGMMRDMNKALELLDVLFRPSDGGFSEELSRFVLSLHFTDAQKDRYLELAEKVTQAPLTTEEQEELESFVYINHILGVLQSKARLSLRRQPAA